MPSNGTYQGSCHCTDCHTQAVEDGLYCECESFRVSFADQYQAAMTLRETEEQALLGRTNDPFDGYKEECSCPWCEAWRRYKGAVFNQLNFIAFVRRNMVMPLDLETAMQTVCKVCDDFHASKARHREYGGVRTYLFCTRCYEAGQIAKCPDCNVYGHSNMNYGRARVTETTFPVSSGCGWPEESPCAECLDNYDVSYCVSCDCRILPDLTEGYVIVEGSDNWYCMDCRDECLEACRCCGAWVEMDDAIGIHNRGYVCISCFDSEDNGYGYCGDCGINYLDDCVCDEGMIQNYTHRPSPIFLFVPSQEHADNTVFYGVELELENKGNISNGRVARNVRDAFDTAIASNENYLGASSGLLYFKRDSSIRNGFEIVSHPFSWAFLKKHSAAFELIFGELEDASFKRQENCGMHVHISKSRFTRLETYKLARFLYGNPFFTERISNREARQFRACADIYGETNKELLEKSREKSGGRRNCLNMNPINTMELRMFTSVDTYDDFMRNMEFCESLCRYVKVTSLKDLWPNLYMDYVSKHSKKFPRIDKYLRNTLF